MTWTVFTTQCFDEWFDEQSEELQDRTLNALGNLQCSVEVTGAIT